MKSHGHTAGGKKLPEYVAWAHLIARCTNPKHPKYPDYGGRGITVCPEWRSSFAAFFEHMGPRPSPEHSIDRENNDGNYEPGNCSWATRTAQRRNRRDVRFLEVDGERMLLSDAARRAGLSMRALRMRLVNGWTLQKALGTPPQHRSCPTAPPVPRFVERDGKRMPLVEAARAAGLHPDTVWGRLGRGWSPERALSTPAVTSHRSA